MGLTLIAWPDRTLEAATTFSGGNWSATLPLTNLKNALLSKVARSTNATSAYTQFVITYAAPIDVRIIALLNHNISLAGTVRVRGYSDAGLTALVYDSLGPELLPNPSFTSDTAGWQPSQCTIASIPGGQSGNCLELTKTGSTPQNVDNSVPFSTVIGQRYRFSIYIKSGTSGNESVFIKACTSAWVTIASATPTTSGAWQLITFDWTATTTSSRIQISKQTATAGTMLFDEVSCKAYNMAWPPDFTAADVAAWPNNWILPLPAVVTARYWLVEIVDTTNAAGYVQIGRCWLGPAFEPESGIAYNDAMGYQSNDILERSMGGVLWGEKRTPQRALTASFSCISPADRQRALIMQKTLGTTGELLWVRNSAAEATDMLLDAFPCTLEQVDALTYPYFNNYQMPMKVKEII